MSLLLHIPKSSPESKNSPESGQSKRGKSVSPKSARKGSRIAQSLLRFTDSSSTPRSTITSSTTTIISSPEVQKREHSSPSFAKKVPNLELSSLSRTIDSLTDETDKIRQVTAMLTKDLPRPVAPKSPSREAFNDDSASPIPVPPLILSKSNSAPATSRPETASTTRPRSLSNTAAVNRRLSFTPRNNELVFERNHLIAAGTQEAELLNNIYQVLREHRRRERVGEKKLSILLDIYGEQKKFRSKKALKEILKILGDFASKGLFFWPGNEDSQSALVDIIDILCTTSRFTRHFNELTKKTIGRITLKCLFGKTADEARRVSYLLELWDPQTDKGSFEKWPPLKSWVQPLFEEIENGALPISTHASSATTYTYAEFESLFCVRLFQLSCLLQKFQEGSDFRSFTTDLLHKSIFAFTFQEHLDNATWLKSYERKKIQRCYKLHQYREVYFEIYRKKAFVEFTQGFLDFNAAFAAVVSLASEKYSQVPGLKEKGDAIISELNPGRTASSSDSTDTRSTNWINLRLLLGQFSFLIEEFEKQEAEKKKSAPLKAQLSRSDSLSSFELSSEESGEESSGYEH